MSDRRAAGYKPGAHAAMKASSDAMRAAADAKRKAAKAAILAKGRAPAKKANLPAQVPRGFVGAAGEAKYVDIASAVYNLNTTGSIAHMSIIPQGTTVNTRVGRKSELKYFQMRGVIFSDSTTTLASWAVYLVWDAQPNKALAAITDVLDTASSHSFSKRENVQRFKILRKWTGVNVGNNATPSTALAAHRIDEYVPLPKGLVIVPTTADATGAIGDIITGALLLLTIGDQAAGTGDAHLTMTARTGFSDIY